MAVATDPIAEAVAAALAEDVGSGDVTTNATVADDAVGTAEILVKESGVVFGLTVARATFAALDPDLRFEQLVADGAVLDPPENVVVERPSDTVSHEMGLAPRQRTAVARVTGSERAILTGERVALNFVARLSGIATLTRRYVDAVAGTGAVILDTRKTTPGLRALEKQAVVAGGGRNHRFGLDDGVLVKDNHLRAAGSLARAVQLVRAATDLPVEVECESLDQVREALAARADAILLDNMSLDDLRRSVELVGGRARLEASGGVSLETVLAIAETGVDEISVGALTHSARSLDVSLELA